MRVLVTGAGGFIGTNLVNKLKHEVVTLDLKPGTDYVADIRSNIFEEVFKKHKIEAVIHLAAKAGVRPSLEDPKLYYDVNVMGTLNLLEAMKKFKINKLIFASSSSVYGNREMGPFIETDNTDSPISPYGASKKAAEVLINSYAYLYGIKSVCLRFFTVYGPYNRPDLAIYKFMDKIANDQRIEKFGDGTTGRDYTYVEDTVEGIIKSLGLDSRYEIINLGNSQPILLNEMISTIEQAVGKKAKVVTKPLQPGDVQLTFADISKAKSLLNWQPQTKFSEGITKMWEWYESTK